jgi:hypothetical protein
MWGAFREKADMASLPLGKQEDVEIIFTIEGTATEVLADLRVLRASRTRRKAQISALTIRAGDQRWWDDQLFPLIADGDADAARAKLNGLVRQRLVTAETERHLDDVITEAEIRTRHA